MGADTSSATTASTTTATETVEQESTYKELSDEAQTMVDEAEQKKTQVIGKTAEIQEATTPNVKMSVSDNVEYSINTKIVSDNITPAAMTMNNKLKQQTMDITETGLTRSVDNSKTFLDKHVETFRHLGINRLPSRNKKIECFMTEEEMENLYTACNNITKMYKTGDDKIDKKLDNIRDNILNKKGIYIPLDMRARGGKTVKEKTVSRNKLITVVVSIIIGLAILCCVAYIIAPYIVKPIGTKQKRYN